MLVELAAAAQQELGDAAAAPLQQRPQPQPCPLPSGLECLSLMHAAPLRLPRRLGEITSLSRLYLSECVLSDEDEDFPAVLLQATALQVRVAALAAVCPCLDTLLAASES